MPVEPWAGSAPFEDDDYFSGSARGAGARFVPLPPELARPQFYAKLTTSLENYLNRERRTLDRWSCPKAMELSRPMEAELNFRLRMASKLSRDLECEQARANWTAWDVLTTLGVEVRPGHATPALAPVTA
jgi:hypothetical protein